MIAVVGFSQGGFMATQLLRTDTLKDVPEFDAKKPSVARIYDYGLGGKDNFASDRETVAELLKLTDPNAPVIAVENRELLTSAVRWAAGQGIDQFLDLGCGMPAKPSIQESAQDVRPGARIVCVDNDPVVVSHLTALLAKDETALAVDQDVADSDAVLSQAARLIDFSRPACLLMGALLHFYELEAARDLLSRYVSALAPGSYAVLTVFNFGGPNADRFVQLYSEKVQPFFIHREADFASFFDGLELVPPGVADARAWRPGWDTVPQPPARDAVTIGGMGRKVSGRTAA